MWFGVSLFPILIIYYNDLLLLVYSGFEVYFIIHIRHLNIYELYILIFLDVVTLTLLQKNLNNLNYFLIFCMSNENKNIKIKVKYFLNVFKHKIYTYPNYYFMF